MSTPTEILEGPMAEGRRLLPTLRWTADVCVIMIAIGLQESAFKVRRQYNNGPAAGYWQFERGGGVRGVMRHSASSGLARQVVDERGVPWDETAIWTALQYDDVLAACFARLLLWTDHRPIPTRTDVDGQYAYYERNWRPGKPHKNDWPINHAVAVTTVIGAQL